MSSERIKELTQALEGMVYQFGYPASKDGRPAISTGGLSALESAFEALGWKDPRFIENPSTPVVVRR